MKAKPVFTVEKQIHGYAYARNGNAHNPTPRVWWNVRDVNGHIVGGGYSYRREAVDLVEHYLHGKVAS